MQHLLTISAIRQYVIIIIIIIIFFLTLGINDPEGGKN